jgi:prophage antirepressor-like protein
MKDQKLISIPLHYGSRIVNFAILGSSLYFLASDILEILDFPSEQILQNYLDPCDHAQALIRVQNSFVPKLLINSSGIFSLLKISTSPDANNFLLWLVKEVYPFILNSILDLSIFSQSLTRFKIDFSLAKFELKQAEKRLAKDLTNHQQTNPSHEK